MEIRIGEIWKSIEGYEDLYEVSNKGRVRNKSGLILKGSTSATGGYRTVVLCKNGKKRGFGVHRLVAKAFVENPRNANVVNHLDENKTNNNADNLEWVTQKENVNYRGARTRLSASMKRYYQSHTPEGCKPVRCIETGVEYPSAKDACKKLGLCKGLVSGVVNGKHETAGGYHWEFV